MKGIIVKDWEALALNNRHSTALCKSFGISRGEHLLRQDEGKLIFSGDAGWHSKSVRSLIGQPGDTLFVKETWRVGAAHRYEMDARIEFKAGGPNVTMRFPSRAEYDRFISNREVGTGRWNSPLNMPETAARYYLQIAGVRVCPLQDITDEECAMLGIRPWTKDGKLFKYYIADNEGDWPSILWQDCPYTPVDALRRIWDSHTADEQQLWRHNPWVQIIRFGGTERGVER